MNGKLKQDLLHALFCFKRTSHAIFRSLLNDDGDGLSVTELSALGCIGRCDEKGCATDQTTHHAMHETLAVSKAAVSQMLGGLEKRGYIQREIDRGNRRRIIIALTEKGETAVGKAEKNMDVLISRIIKGFGEKNSQDFVRLLGRFAEIADRAINKTE
jgi:DNA-binding MarR family transcriptional regulator